MWNNIISAYVIVYLNRQYEYFYSKEFLQFKSFL